MSSSRILIVGAGTWGRVWIEKVQAHPRLKLAAVVARTGTTLQQIAAQYFLDRAMLFTDLSTALRAVNADLVAIASPAAFHMEHIITSLEAGKHVICEKPLTDSWESARRIAAATMKHSSRKFMVAQTRRFTSQVQTIHHAVASGKIGTVDTINFDHRVYCRVGGYRQKMALPVLEDMIIHHLDAIRFICGVDAVSAYAEAWNPSWSQFEGQASNNVLATLTNGVHVNYFGTWTARGQLNDYDGLMNIMGSKGSVHLVDKGTLLFHPLHNDDTGPSPAAEKIPMIKVEHAEVEGVLDAFLYALDHDAQPPCDIDDNLRTFAFHCAVLQSCRCGRRVDVAEVVGKPW